MSDSNSGYNPYWDQNNVYVIDEYGYQSPTPTTAAPLPVDEVGSPGAQPVYDYYNVYHQRDGSQWSNIGGDWYKYQDQGWKTLSDLGYTGGNGGWYSPGTWGSIDLGNGLTENQYTAGAAYDPNSLYNNPMTSMYMDQANPTQLYGAGPDWAAWDAAQAAAAAAAAAPPAPSYTAPTPTTNGTGLYPNAVWRPATEGYSYPGPEGYNEWSPGTAAGWYQPSSYTIHGEYGSEEQTTWKWLGETDPNMRYSAPLSTGYWNWNPNVNSWVQSMGSYSAGDTQEGSIASNFDPGGYTLEGLYGPVARNQFLSSFYDPYASSIPGLIHPDQFLNASQLPGAYAERLVTAGSDNMSEAGRASNDFIQSMQVLNAYMNQPVLMDARGGTAWDWHSVPQLTSISQQYHDAAKAQAQQIFDVNTAGTDWGSLAMGALSVFAAPLMGIATAGIGFNALPGLITKLAGITGLPGTQLLGTIAGGLDSLVGGLPSGPIEGFTSGLEGLANTAGDFGASALDLGLEGLTSDLSGAISGLTNTAATIPTGDTGMFEDIFGGGDFSLDSLTPSVDLMGDTSWFGDAINFDVAGTGLDNIDLMGDLGDFSGGLTGTTDTFDYSDFGAGNTGFGNVDAVAGATNDNPFSLSPLYSDPSNLLSTLSTMGSTGMTIARLLGLGGTSGGATGGTTSGTSGGTRTGTSGGTGTGGSLTSTQGTGGGGIFGGGGGTGGLSDIINSMLSYSNFGDTQDYLKQLLQQGITSGDPFAAHRPASGNLLMQSYNDPLSIWNKPEYQALDKAFQDSQLARDAQAGQLFNAPERVSQREVNFLKQLDEFRKPLLPMSGANYNPGIDSFIAKMAGPITAAGYNQNEALGSGISGGLDILGGLLGGGGTGGGSILDTGGLMNIFSGGSSFDWGNTGSAIYDFFSGGTTV